MRVRADDCAAVGDDGAAVDNYVAVDLISQLARQATKKTDFTVHLDQ